MIFKSKEKKQLEKQQKELEEKQKKVKAFQWLFALAFATMAIATAPTIVMLLFILLTVAVMPVKPIEKVWGKIPIKGKWFKPAALVAAFFITCMLAAPILEEQDKEPASIVVNTTEDSGITDEKATVKDTSDDVKIQVNTTPKDETKEDTKPQEDEKTTETDVPEASTPQVTLADIPAYSGKAYIEVNGNVPYFNDSELVTTSFENYSSLDSLGRCGIAYANICTEIMPTEERGSIGSVKPSGWGSVKYDCVDGKYLYNRCHLIGFQLAGENANEKNLITGTRYLNVDGMLPFENMVADYVKETNNHVLYRVTPVYDGNNLVASGVLMEAKSVEDKGEGILFNVYCYNNQPGVSINYADGSSQLDGTQTTTTVTETPSSSNTQTETTTPAVDTSTPAGSSGAYVVNGNNGKIHMDGGCAATGSGASAMTNEVFF